MTLDIQMFNTRVNLVKNIGQESATTSFSSTLLLWVMQVRSAILLELLSLEEQAVSCVLLVNEVDVRYSIADDE